MGSQRARWHYGVSPAVDTGSRPKLTIRFGCVLLPDDPDNVAEGFDPEEAFAAPAEGSGSWRDEKDGTRRLRLWGLSLGMTL